MPRQCEHKGTPQRDGDIAWLWTPPCEPFETVGPNSVPPAIAASPTGTTRMLDADSLPCTTRSPGRYL